MTNKENFYVVKKQGNKYFPFCTLMGRTLTSRPFSTKKDCQNFCDKQNKLHLEIEKSLPFPIK